MFDSFQKRSTLLLLLMVFSITACVKAKRPPQQVDVLEKKTELSPVLEKTEKKSVPPVEAPASQPEVSEKDLPQKPAPDPRLDLVIQQFQRGIRLLSQNKVQKAKTLFETLRNDHPGVSVFHLNLGVVYKRLGRLEDAVHAYKQAISIAERSPGGGYAEAYYNLAIVLREQGIFKDAEAAYLRAITIDRDFQDAHFNLAVLYDLYLNEPARAILHYQRHLALKGEVDEEIAIWIASLEKRLKAGKGQP